MSHHKDIQNMNSQCEVRERQKYFLMFLLSLIVANLYTISASFCLKIFAKHSDAIIEIKILSWRVVE